MRYQSKYDQPVDRSHTNRHRNAKWERQAAVDALLIREAVEGWQSCIIYPILGMFAAIGIALLIL